MHAVKVKMRHLFDFCILVSLITVAAGLKCMTCYGATSFEECDVNGRIEECRINQKTCETIVRRHNDRLVITKGCKDATACQSNQLQNNARAGKSNQCNSDQITSVCTCCCNENLCNSGTPSCVTYYQNTGPVNDCPAVPQTFPDGNIECYNDNKAGSVCEYQCTGKDYEVWPPARDNNVCRGNGSWAFEQPCCTRPCPPYVLYDDVVLYHFSGKDAKTSLEWVTSSPLAYGAIEEDALKISVLYFGEDVVESSVIKFNEYGTNATLLNQLGLQRIKNVGENALQGPSNAIRAVRYALDNLLTPESGMRDSRVPKSISIFTNRDWDDDVKEVAQEARDRGILMFLFLIKQDDYKYDKQKLIDFTGEEKHIFRFDIYGNNEAVLGAQMADVVNHFCFAPCDHVLHDHE